MKAAMQRPLSDVRVLDISQAASGPLCASWLAAMGATVIKVERPDTGDMARRTPPYATAEGLASVRAGEQDIASTILKRNRDKQSLALDLQKPAGLKILQQLVEKSDVVVENFRPGATSKLHIDYESLKQFKPDLIYCSITGFGLSGPYTGWAAFDTIIQAMTGVMATTGLPDGVPTKSGLIVGDTYAPLFALSGILAALRHRDRTGEGQLIEVSMFDCLVSLIWDEPIEYYVDHEIKGRSGNRFLRMAPWNAYRSSDGYIIICAGQQEHFRRVCEVIGRPELATDARYREMEDRLRNFAELDGIIEDWTRNQTRQAAVALCQKAGIPCGPVNELVDLVNDPHLKARELLKPLLHPRYGEIPGASVARFPTRFSGFETAALKPAPALGEHTEQILTETLGLSRETILDLAKDGVVKLAP